MEIDIPLINDNYNLMVIRIPIYSLFNTCLYYVDKRKRAKMQCLKGIVVVIFSSLIPNALLYN